MLANMGYTAVVLQTGAAILQVATPMTADQANWALPAHTVDMHQAWSDRTFRFSFAAPQYTEITINEEQSQTLHKALISSFDDFIAPILIA